MFVDAVLANLLVFAVGQVFACLYWRSGRFWVGAGATVVLWAAVDVWLVQRYLLAAPAERQGWAVLAVQVTSALVAGNYLWTCLRRRLGRSRRPDRFRRGMAELLQGRLEVAEATFRQLVWCDPWDVPAWIARGDACRRLGRVRRARWCYRRAAGVDTAGRYADVLGHRRGRIGQAASKMGSIPPGITPHGVGSVSGNQTGVRKAASGT